MFLPDTLSQDVVPSVEQDAKGQQRWILIGPAKLDVILLVAHACVYI
jgi:hypothetical protein